MADRAEKKQAIRDAMMAFFGPSPQAAEAWRLDRVKLIVDGVASLRKDGEFWVPTFYGGESIAVACDLAWAILCHTREKVQFRFNGVLISMIAEAA